MAGIDVKLPLQSGRFLVEIDSVVVANFQECSGLTIEVEVQEYTEGGFNEGVHKLPGRIKYTNIKLTKGFTDDPLFANWLPKVEGGKITVERKNLSIILFTLSGETAKRWEVSDAYPIKWTGPDLKAGSMEILLESVELVHTGIRVA
jgi:phage tail-like protein